MPPIEEIKEKIEEYNKHPEWLALDKLTGEIFNNEGNTYNIAKQVLIISRGWKGLQGEAVRYEKQFLENITGYWNEITLNIIRIPLTNNNIEEIIDKMNNLWDLFFRNINGEYSVFFSKFLHWLAPETFPITDKNSRKILHIYYDYVEENLPARDKYEKVIRAYGELIDNLENEDANILTQLVDYDYQTQILYPLLQRINTPLRVLDKWLWLKRPDNV